MFSFAAQVPQFRTVMKYLSWISVSEVMRLTVSSSMGPTRTNQTIYPSPLRKDFCMWRRSRVVLKWGRIHWMMPIGIPSPWPETGISSSSSWMTPVNMCKVKWTAPEKNVTRILMEIPCHFSRHNSTWWRFGPNPYQIPWLFHVICPGFIYFPWKNMIWIFGQVQVMEFPWHLLRKWWDFHRIWSHFRPNGRQKDTRKSMSQFLQGYNRGEG